MEKATLDVTEVASYLGVSKDTIYQMVRERGIPFFKVGKRILFTKESVDHWMHEQEFHNLRGDDNL
ncbi:DNA-binding protein [Alkalihalophilus pseudofirmus]|nr:DNA-binding protein [Alkalihalophilus pseudofirmus]